MSQYHQVTMSQLHNFTISPCHNFLILPCYHFTISQFHNITMSQYHHVTMSPYHHITMSPCHQSQYQHVTMSPITISTCHHVTISHCQNEKILWNFWNGKTWSQRKVCVMLELEWVPLAINQISNSNSAQTNLSTSTQITLFRHTFVNFFEFPLFPEAVSFCQFFCNISA